MKREDSSRRWSARTRSRGEALVALEDVERLADCRAAARRRAHAPDVEAAIAAAGRGTLDGAVATQVVGGHQARAPGVVGVGGLGRVLRGLGHRARQLAAVERVHSLASQQPVGACEVGVLEGRADVARRAVGVEVDRGRRGDVVEPVDVGRGLVEEGLVDGEAVAGHADAGAQGSGERPGAVAVQGALPGGGRARDAGRHAAVAPRVEGERRAVLPERVRAHRAGRLLAPVDRGDLALGGADHHESAAADAAGERLGHSKHAGRRHGGVDRVPALAQRPDGGLRPGEVHACGSATASDRGRLLLLRKSRLWVEQDDRDRNDHEETRQKHHARGIPEAFKAYASAGACRRINCSSCSSEDPGRGTSTMRSMPSCP